mgnify:CR=1 FL=1
MAKSDKATLFSHNYHGATSREPLAARMRPRTLDEFIGQEHIVGPGRLLRRAIQKDQLSSILLSGPPGTGKTTLARIIANTTSSNFLSLNAVLAGIADLRTAIEKAKDHFDLYGKRTILFVDEVHRWNKSQQDALLPWVENGTIILIGATTENPFFEVNNALVSRSRVFLLKALTDADLEKIAWQALHDSERGYGKFDIHFEKGALEHLIHTADGDARSLLNALELAVETSVLTWPPHDGDTIEISMAIAEESIQKRAILYDKDGDYHYDAISAFIKSIRGSDPDASLYWLARMVYAGEDPSFIFRRLLILAAEDIGLADPSAIATVNACAQAFDRIGLPEGQYHLSLATLYLATCPKSNSTMGYFDALAAVEQEFADVPNHLKDANRDQKGFGHGEGYKYPHAYKDHWVAQQYLPDSLRHAVFYYPSDNGLEKERKTAVLEKREAQLALLPGDFDSQNLPDASETAIWSMEGEKRKKWLARAEGSTSSRLLATRSLVFDFLRPSRSENLLIVDPRKGFYSLEALRRCPEGSSAVIIQDEESRSLLEMETRNLAELAKPFTLVWNEPGDQINLQTAFGFSSFDMILVCETSKTENFGETLFPWLLSNSTYEKLPRMIIFFEILARRSSRISELLKLNAKPQDSERIRIIAELEHFENEYGSGPGYRREQTAKIESCEDMMQIISQKLIKTGLNGELKATELAGSFTRQLADQELESWFSDASPYQKALIEKKGKAFSESVKSMAKENSSFGKWPIFLAIVNFSPRQAK